MKFRGEKNGRNRIGTRRIWDRDYRSDSSRPHLLTAMTRAGVNRSPERKRHEQPAARRRSHPSRRSFGTARRIWKPPEATWAQPLGPGRAVLTRGVSRRSGSVAYVRADASPTEVLAVPWLHRCPSHVKRVIELLTQRQRAWVGSHPPAPLGAHAAPGREAYPRQHGHNIAGASRLDGARHDVHRIEKPDVAPA
jgi:hypothetical protein